MTDLLRDTIAASLAELEQLTAFPEPPLGYGTDLWNDGDFADDMREVDGNTVEALAQALFHRLDTRRGGLPCSDPWHLNPDGSAKRLREEAAYGFDLVGALNKPVTTEFLSSVQRRIHSELSKDDRVSSLEVEVPAVIDIASATIRVIITVTPFDPAVGKFRLTLTASSATILLDSIREAA